MIDASGTEYAAASAATPFVASADGIEMAVADLAEALATAVAGLGPVRQQVAAVGVAGIAESGAPLRAGAPVGPIIAWHDGRGEETVSSLDRRFGPDLPRWAGRRIRTVSSLAKLGWLLDHGCPVPDRWLGVPELGLWLLTGAEATEHSLAARTGAYHVIDGRFLPEVIAHVLQGHQRTRASRAAAAAPGGAQAAAGIFPPVWAAGTVMGLVSEGGAARYGVPAGIPVTIAGHDHLAAGAALGGRPDDLLNSVGTAETVLRRVASPPDVERALAFDLAVTLWPGGTSWAVLASAARSGVVLGQLAASLGRSPAELDRLSESLTLDETTGRVGAGEVEAARRWRDALTDLADRTVEAGTRVADLVGPHRRLVVFGGGSRSAPWLAAKARKAGVPVLRSTVADAAARGAALAAGVAARWWPAVSAGPTPLLARPDADTRACP